MLKRVVLGWVALTLAACSGGARSEQVVQRNRPADEATRQEAGEGSASRAVEPALGTGAEARNALTSQEVEKALNRLEAELR